MRQIGTLSDERQVVRAADYLLTLGIRVQVERGESGFTVWAIDEDRVAQARKEFNHFVQNPQDERYLAAEHEARKLRDDMIRQEKDRRQKIVDVRRQWSAPRVRPLTFLLIVICCAVAFATGFGEKKESYVWQKLVIASYEVEGQYILYHPVFGLGSDVFRGQVWRLITPIFLHNGLVHLLMNLMALQSVGTLIEIRRGTWRLVLIVFVTAMISNVAQYLFSGPGFCGISGVVLGMFGYAWMKSEFDPAAGIAIPRSSVTMMLVFVGLCMTGLIGPIANAAHIGGLVTGMLLGYAPVAARRALGR
jgi:GlpG protein